METQNPEGELSPQQENQKNNKSEEKLKQNDNSKQADSPTTKASSSKRTLVIIAGAFLLIMIILVSLVVIMQGIKEKQTSATKETTTKSPQTIKQKLANQNTIQEFQNYSELEKFLEENTTKSTSYQGMGGWSTDRSMSLVEESVGDSTSFVNPTSMKTGGSDDFSATNVQVEGVDEADIVKTDGEYIYTVTDNNLFIVRSFPPGQANVVAKIQFTDRPQNIYLNGNNLIVFGRNQEIRERDYYKKFRRRSSYSFFKVFDISDKKNPRQVKNLDFEGDYSNSRMIGDHVYFLTTTTATYYEDEIPVPRILDNEKEVYAYSQADNTCIGCPEVFYVDMPHTGYQLINVATINVKDNNQKVSSQIYLLPHNQNLYVSQNNLFLTYTKHVSEYDLMMEMMTKIIFPRLSEKSRERIAKIQATETYILNPMEKMSKVTKFVERYVETLNEEDQKTLEQEMKQEMKNTYTDLAQELEQTVIHKISISGKALQYKGYGQVTGSVLNQFSMDEKDGFFRIATTKNRSWSRYFDDEDLERESYNNMYILDEGMHVVGSLEKLAKDEKIYSVRFMQDRAYMVTFKQMDPLFVIDLKDPTAPKVLGELKIPGFSNYLHPYDENLLIGLGKETKADQFGGFTQEGLKLSLFDVSDTANPREVHKYVFENRSSNSIATREHKAFLFSKEKNLLSIPVSTSGFVDGGMIEPLIDEEIAISKTRKPFRGAAVFHVDKNGFTLKGMIDHSTSQDKAVPWYGSNCYSSTVKRSLYIDKTLYTLSDNFIKMNTISDLNHIGTVDLRKKPKDDWNVVN